MTVLHCDFESRSTVDLRTAGLDNYAKHPTTDVWCMAYAFDDRDVHLWAPDRAQHAEYPVQLPIRATEHVANGGVVVAHSAHFELAIWNEIMVPRYGWPPLRPEQCRCTMAAAYAQALPGALENAAPALGIAEAKDQAGKRLMLMMSRPREIKPDGTIIWWDDDPAKIERLHAYCKNDVVVERELERRLMPLSAAEQHLWVLDYRVNQRGIYIDTAAVKAAIALVTAEQDRINLEMRRITQNFVGFATEVKRLTDWVRSRGVPVDGLAKGDIVEALTLDLPDDVRAALLLRQEAGKTSTAKLRAMLDAVSSDGRLRGTLQYHGASTGRWAGRRVQVHNLPRSKISQDEIDEVFAALEGVARG